jgi:hypothetical protein
MDSRIHFFSQNDFIPSKDKSDLLGIRGRQANELAQLEFQILPGIILDTEISSEIDPKAIKKDIAELLEKCAKIVGKKFKDSENPMLLKFVISSTLAITNYPTLHNFGLVMPSIDGFTKWVGESFAVSEVLFLINGMMIIEERIKELEGKLKEKDEISAKIKLLKRLLGVKGPSNELHQEKEPPLPKKKTAVEAWLEKNGFRPNEACFYSDSYTDLSLMEFCGKPVAVNPDRILAREAKKHGWEILRFTKTLGKH